MEKPQISANINNSSSQVAQNVMTQNPDQSKNNHKKIAIFIILSAILLFLGVVSIILRGNPSKSVSARNNTAQDLQQTSPTPVPFYEMTIPYLRGRSYSSELSNIEKVAANANYISYLTSYNSDGLKINAQLTVPTTDMPLQGFPAIVFIHGYIPPPNYQTLVNYSSYVDYLARNGFVVLKIDLRGHGSSEGEASGAYYSSDYIVDVLNARAALQSFEDVNPNAIGIWGHSMAGNVTLRALAAMPEIPAAVIWAGAVYTYDDWEEYGIQDNSYRPPTNQSERQKKRDELFEIHGRFSKDSPFWSTVAPTNYLADLKGAISLNHAVDDDVVNIGYSRGLAKLLENNNIAHELNEFSSGGHNISGKSFAAAMEKTVTFFKKYLY